jgi:IS1 family transposase
MTAPSLPLTNFSTLLACDENQPTRTNNQPTTMTLQQMKKRFPQHMSDPDICAHVAKIFREHDEARKGIERCKAIEAENDRLKAKIARIDYLTAALRRSLGKASAVLAAR